MSKRQLLALVGLGIAIAVGLVVLIEGPQPPPAVPPRLERVIQDDTVFLHEPSTLSRHLDEIESLGFTRLRLTAGWSVLAPHADSLVRPSFDAAEPGAYERYGISFWDDLDRAVRAADERGIGLLIDIAFWAPRWAAGPTADGSTRHPRTNIDVDEYRQFALAVVRRYDGSYSPPGEDPLPRVDMFSIWNEPNITGFFGPQWQPDGRGGRVPLSPHLYRAMVEAAYPAIKDERPETTVLVGGLGAGGSYDNAGLRGGVPPLQFLRELACVDRGLRPLARSGCDRFSEVPGDGFSIHPYGFRLRPDQPGRPDDVHIGDLGRLISTLRSLAERDRIAPELVDVYITEFGYKTSPPDPRGVSYARQLQYMLWSEALAFDRPEVKMFAQFLVRDSVCEGCLDWPTGYRDGRGRPKPLMSGLRLGAIAISDGRKLRLWGRAPGEHQAGSLRFEYQNAEGDWRSAEPLLESPLRVLRGGIASARTVPLQAIPPSWRLVAAEPDGDEVGPPTQTAAWRMPRNPP